MNASLPAPTPEQVVICEATPPFVVRACPGSGKTRAIVDRFVRLAAVDLRSAGVAVLSFTNLVAEEIRDRCGRSSTALVPGFPNFVGTIDAFIGRYFAVPFNPWGAKRQPVLLDSWDRVPHNVGFQGTPVSLDWLEDADGPTPKFDPRLVQGKLDAVPADKVPGLVSRAAALRKSLLRRGYISSHDARIAAAAILADRSKAAALGRALSSRFREVLVDEAQDCNGLDWRIFEWLAAVGVPVCYVADVDQAIYEFRGGEPGRLADRARATKELTLTANFRSAPSICGFAATLRADKKPDKPVGKHSTEAQKVVVIDGQKLSSEFGQRFVAHAGDLGIPEENCIVLGHADAVACRVAGQVAQDNRKDSKLVQLADAVSLFRRRGATARDLALASQAIKLLLLSLLNMEVEAQTPEDKAEEEGIPSRWLGRAALQLLTSLPLPPKKKEDVSAWIDRFKTELFALSGPDGKKPAFNLKKLPRAPTGSWSIRPEGERRLPAMTVHKAKGCEFDAVLFVIPESKARSQELLDAWEKDVNDEVRRVAYVGVTRARRLLGIAVASKQRDALLRILAARKVEVDRVTV